MEQLKNTFLAFIGGTGLYDLPGIENLREEEVETPFGAPSDKIILGQLNGRPIAFLPRHGRGHRFLPSEVNYRANIYALKKLGVTHIVSVSAVGSLKENYGPGTVVIPDQIIDRTQGTRPRSFFGNGVVGHVSFATPYCSSLQFYLEKVCIEGPRFSTKSESLSYIDMGGDIIGMTAMPEAVLAREAEIPYATLAFVTDYDCWREEEEPVTVEMVLKTLKQNTDIAKNIIAKLHQHFPESSTNEIFHAAKHAIITSPEYIPQKIRDDLSVLYEKYW
jgi:5'-methylthioadenosine phosphorylase